MGSTTQVQALQLDQAQVNVSITARSQPTSIQPKIWGVFTKDDIHNDINVLYEEIVFWRQNLFKLERPQGRNLFQKQQSGLSFGTRCCSKSPHANACPTSPEANIQLNSKRTLPVLVKAFGTMGVG